MFHIISFRWEAEEEGVCVPGGDSLDEMMFFFSLSLT